MDEKLAVGQLMALLNVPGALKIITNEVRPEYREDPHDPRSQIKEEAIRANPRLISSLHAFVFHDVVQITGPNHKGRYMARSKEGDSCTSTAIGLLRRLTEWQDTFFLPKAIEQPGDATIYMPTADGSGKSVWKSLSNMFKLE